MRILLAGDFSRSVGSSQAVFNYCRVAGAHGHEVKVSEKYSRLDPYVKHRFDLCREEDWADRWIVITESYPYLSEIEIREIQATIPRDHIWLVDTDGHYGPTVTSGEDSNHTPSHPSDFWHDHYAALSDRILQPRLSPLPGGARFFPFYGMPSLPAKPRRWRAKPYSVLYVGHNWYRWEAVEAFLSDLRPIRPRLGRIALRGMWWNGDGLRGLEEHTHAEGEILRELRIKVEPSIPFGGAPQATLCVTARRFPSGASGGTEQPGARSRPTPSVLETAARACSVTSSGEQANPFTRSTFAARSSRSAGRPLAGP